MSQSQQSAGDCGHGREQAPTTQKGKLRHRAKKGLKLVMLCPASVPAATQWVRLLGPSGLTRSLKDLNESYFSLLREVNFIVLLLCSKFSVT